ncbi:hypothetical protein [Bacillus sp. FJAT-50079]|uniref:hypothetical protein n=1 Tax=Bacillus sp. FJAT-50079 TaxID=2833577 RepID=UPI001BC8D582|nr:hypothetical protein [Bacillus sp. FJAT-50079]MBS4207118.1 hypothetical protein [Bacillus sp. FJAT-50079]
MKRIQRMKDVHVLKTRKHLPSFYVEEIENQFLMWYEAENEGESLKEFSLLNHSCIYHFDKEEDMQMLVDYIGDVEYVEVENVAGKKYFRIGLMQDHHISIIYFLEGTLPRKTERWLTNKIL